MQKTGVLLIALCVIGFTNAYKVSDCAYKFPTLLMLDRCCYQIGGITTYDVAYGKCLEQYEKTPNPEYCATWCALNETKLACPDGSVNYEAYHAFLVENVKDPLIIKHMEGTVKNCEIKIGEMLKEPRYNTDVIAPCSPRIKLLHDCTASHGILKCPVQKWKNGDSYCDQILEDAKDCPF